MHLMCRAAGLLLLLTSTFVTAGPAAAAVPGNDTIATATAIQPGFSGMVDTTTATTDDTEISLASSCGWSQPSAGVWYKFTAASASNVYLDGWTVPYYADAPVASVVATGGPDALFVATCGWSQASWYPQPDTTYYILMFDPYPQPPTGGNLHVLFSDESTVPQLELAFTGATINQVGWADVKANVKCSGARQVWMSFTITEKVGRSFVSGSASPTLQCDGASHQQVMTVKGGAPFVGGKAILEGNYQISNNFHMVEGTLHQELKLTGGGKS